MRKTKLIILPTKCLNQMGFLLLFLSCPVIGDWGRIRPDSEMSQWSILIEREGSCGLVRDSPGINDKTTPDGLMECYAADAMHRNNTQSLTEITETNPERKTDFGSHPDLPIHESRIQMRNVRSSRIQTDAKGRESNARRESREMSFRRSLQVRNIRTEKRAVSLDRKTSFRYDERRNERMQREVRGERDSRRTEYRRISRSLDRSDDARRITLARRSRDTTERVHDTARRLSLSRRERDVNERRDDVEIARRRTENERRIREARLSQSRNERRVEEQRLTRRLLQDGRKDVRRDAERQNVARRVREDRFDAERRNSPEMRMERREHHEERRVAERRSLEERLTREVAARRSVDRVEGRADSSERRVRASTTRERVDRDIRTARRNAAPERRIRDTTEISRRREERERNVRSSARSERRLVPESRRIESESSRRQELGVSIRRVEKPEDMRDFDRVSARLRENREKSARVNYRMSQNLEPFTLKNEKNGRWEFLDGLKTYFGLEKNQEGWMSNHGDFATTCLVGVAVYYLTTRQVKSV